MLAAVRAEDNCGENGDGAELDGKGECFVYKDSSVASHCCQLSDNMLEQTLGERRWHDGKSSAKLTV